MNYIEISIPISNTETGEILIALLSDFPFDSFAEEENVLKAYIRKNDWSDVQSEVGNLLEEQDAEYTQKEIEEVNWNALWESNFDPIIVEGQCMIRAPFHPADSSCEYDIVMMPKMAFGTGHHATTYLMAAEILNNDFKGKEGLDMGCGTGVLAILAVKRGAKHVDAIDIDEWAYENCIENISVNDTADAISPQLGDATLLKGKKYNFVLANINRNILLEDMKAYADTLSPGGSLFMSGILEEDVPVITEKAVSLGMSLQNQRVRNNWAMLRFKK